MCRHFNEDFKLDTKVVRYHNVYGPKGTYEMKRKSSCIMQKNNSSKLNNYKSIDVWGDGSQKEALCIIKIV